MSAFAQGEAEAFHPQAVAEETMGASFRIKTTRPGSGVQEPQIVSNPIQSVHFRNGNMETVTPSIVNTPLGALMPGPDAIAPAVVVDPHWGQPMPAAGHGFDVGIGDGYPEGCPVPVS